MPNVVITHGRIEFSLEGESTLTFTMDSFDGSPMEVSTPANGKLASVYAHAFCLAIADKLPEMLANIRREGSAGDAPPR